MQDGWFMVLILLGLITFGGTLLVFWLLRAAATQREAEALNASDLRMLEDSVQALIDRLKSASDEAVAEINVRQRRLHALLDRADAVLAEADGSREHEPPRAPELAGAGVIATDGVETEDALGLRDVCRLADEGVSGLEIARRAGLSRAEVELILELQAARR